MNKVLCAILFSLAIVSSYSSDIPKIWPAVKKPSPTDPFLLFILSFHSFEAGLSTFRNDKSATETASKIDEKRRLGIFSLNLNESIERLKSQLTSMKSDVPEAAYNIASRTVESLNKIDQRQLDPLQIKDIDKLDLAELENISSIVGQCVPEKNAISEYRAAFATGRYGITTLRESWSKLVEASSDNRVSKIALWNEMYAEIKMVSESFATMQKDPDLKLPSFINLGTEGVMISGMSPNEIKDEKTRKRYESAIAANNNIIAKKNYEIALKNLLRRMDVDSKRFITDNTPTLQPIDEKYRAIDASLEVLETTK